MKVLVLSIEGGIASIVLENGKHQNIIKALLPYGAKVGDIIDIESGKVSDSDYYEYSKLEGRL